jgi:hypothetical protein
VNIHSAAILATSPSNPILAKSSILLARLNISMTFKEYMRQQLRKKKKKSPLPQADKTPLVTSADMIPTQSLPAATGGNQPSLS